MHKYWLQYTRAVCNAVFNAVCNSVCMRYRDIMSGTLCQKSSRLGTLRTELKECETIHQPKNDQNFTSLINVGPRLNAGFKLTPGPWGQVLKDAYKTWTGVHGPPHGPAGPWTTPNFQKEIAPVNFIWKFTWIQGMKNTDSYLLLTSLRVCLVKASCFGIAAPWMGRPQTRFEIQKI